MEELREDAGVKQSHKEAQISEERKQKSMTRIGASLNPDFRDIEESNNVVKIQFNISSAR